MRGEYAIAHGDVLTTLRELPSDSFDALLCDPPYGFSFMGKKWDYDVPSVEVWRETLRVLKPGAPLLAFGGARTFHRIATGIEDAGFELRDCLMWLYGKGFPKSMNIAKAVEAQVLTGGSAPKNLADAVDLTGQGAPATATDRGLKWDAGDGTKQGVPRHAPGSWNPTTDLAKAWDGYGTALKPAYEPIILARKPLIGTMAENVAGFGVGGLAIDACRIDWQGKPSGWSKSGSGASENVAMTGANYARDAKPDAEGRWPANLLLDEASAAALDASVPATKSVPYKANKAAGNVLDMTARTAGGYDEPASGPSRFFYCAKVSTKERERGCESLPMRTAGEITGREDGSIGLENPRTGAGRTGGARNHHPTLKPIGLTRWLASLIKPPTADAKLLIPFSGAGSEMIGALLAGWPLVLGIEGEAEYVQIAHARIREWTK